MYFFYGILYHLHIDKVRISCSIKTTHHNVIIFSHLLKSVDTGYELVLNSPRNENLNLLVRIKFLNSFLYISK
jgi:hypothetical protein